MTIDVSNALAGLIKLTSDIEGATEGIVRDALHLFQAEEMRKAPIGTPGNTTNAPGDLARSIDVEGPTGGFGFYEGRVGPTMVYSWQREKGGYIHGNPLLHFFRFGEEIYARSVFQVGSYFVRKSYDETLPSVQLVLDARIGAVVAEFD